MNKYWHKIRNIFFQVNSRTIYFHSFVVGGITGCIAILFHYIIHGIHSWLFLESAGFPLDTSDSVTSHFPGIKTILLVLFIPTLGGLMVGLLTHFWAPEAKGSGLDHLLESFHKQGGIVRKRTAFAKFITSTLTLSSGGSAGKEGPMALIGGGIGSLFGKLVKMGARAQRTMLLAGSAGGLGAIFRAPLGGAITTIEVLYKEDFEADALLPCIISSVTAYTFFSSIVGFGHSLSFDQNISHGPVELIFFAILGLICSGAGVIFVKFNLMMKSWFQKIKVHKIFKPAIGGLLIGCIGLFIPQAIGEGLGTIQSLLNLNFNSSNINIISIFLLLAVVKMMTANITICSEGSGGILIPSFFVGALIGAAFGILVHHLFPEYSPSIAPYVIVGMGGFLASVTNASLGTLVMVTELTGGYELLPPLMIVATISLIVSRKWSIYENQVKNKFFSDAHTWDLKTLP